MLKRLPRPVSLYCIKGVIFRIYRLKKMHERAYGNRALYYLMLEARRSYYRYGDVPLLDGHDKKSAVYLVRVTYALNKTDEWLCARFVPGNGIPFGIDDFKLYFHKGRPLEQLVQGLIVKGLFSISRLCGIPSCGKSALIYTPISFALMNKQVLADCRKFGFKCDYVVAQIPDALIEGFLTLKTDKEKLKPNFVPAHKLFGVKGKDIRLARTNYIYLYPLYFLNTKQVICLLKDLLKKGTLTDATVKHYFGGDITASEIIVNDRIKVEKFRNLGKLFSVKGKIKGSNITGSDLRELLAKVDDGPRLRIAKVAVWEKSLDELLAAARKNYLNRPR